MFHTPSSSFQPTPLADRYLGEFSLDDVHCPSLAKLGEPMEVALCWGGEGKLIAIEFLNRLNRIVTDKFGSFVEIYSRMVGGGVVNEAGPKIRAGTLSVCCPEQLL